MNQVVASYDTATTYVSRKNRLIIHSEWPSGKCNGLRSYLTYPILGIFYFSLTYVERFARPHWWKEWRWQGYYYARVISACSVRFEFPSAGKNRFGARETFSYTIEGFAFWLARSPSWFARFCGVKNDAPRLQYTRHGERPPRYGFYLSELKGCRLNSLSEALVALSSFFPFRGSSCSCFIFCHSEIFPSSDKETFESHL